MNPRASGVSTFAAPGSAARAVPPTAASATTAASANRARNMVYLLGGDATRTLSRDGWLRSTTRERILSERPRPAASSLQRGVRKPLVEGVVMSGGRRWWVAVVVSFALADVAFAQLPAGAV